MTPEKKRELLRIYMADCPACVPEEVDAIADDDLDEWLTARGNPVHGHPAVDPTPPNYGERRPCTACEGSGKIAQGEGFFDDCSWCDGLGTITVDPTLPKPER